MKEHTFWKRTPPRILCDIRAWSLLLPAIAATLGAIAYSIQGIAASQGGHLPAGWVTTAVQWGAVMLAIGCEGGTLSAMVEVARKVRDGDATKLDTYGIAVSFAATVTARLLALTNVRTMPVIYLLVGSSVADAYFLFREHGDYVSIRDRNYARWEVAKRLYEQFGSAELATRALNGERITSDVVRDIVTEETEINMLLINYEQASAQSFPDAHDVTQDKTTMAQGNGHNLVVCPHCGADKTKDGKPITSLSAHLRWCDVYQAQKVKEESA